MSDNTRKLLEESSLSQILITIMLFGLTAIVQIQTGDIPEWLKTADSILLGFYFGGKVAALTNKQANTMDDARKDAKVAGNAEGMAAGMASAAHVEHAQVLAPTQPANTAAVIEVVGGVAITDVQAGAHVDEVKVRTAPTRTPTRKPAKPVWTKAKAKAKPKATVKRKVKR